MFFTIIEIYGLTLGGILVYMGRDRLVVNFILVWEIRIRFTNTREDKPLLHPPGKPPWPQ